MADVLAPVFLFICIAASFIAYQHFKYQKQRAKLDFIRNVVEKGHAIDIELIEKIMPTTMPARKQSVPPDQSMRVVGTVVFAAGVGLLVFAAFLSYIEIRAFYALGGVGAMVCCIGVGAWVAGRHLKSNDHA